MTKILKMVFCLLKEQRKKLFQTLKEIIHMRLLHYLTF